MGVSYVAGSVNYVRQLSATLIGYGAKLGLLSAAKRL